MNNPHFHKIAARIMLVAGALTLALVPSQASAHDNLGGDELAVANWMLVGAMVTVVLGVLWGIWAFRTGQFSNVESSKYSMLESAEDYDAIMAEYDARTAAAAAPAAATVASQKPAQTDPVLPRTTTGSKTISA